LIKAQILDGFNHFSTIMAMSAVYSQCECLHYFSEWFRADYIKF
jgi:hypothetical protein